MLKIIIFIYICLYILVSAPVQARTVVVKCDVIPSSGNQTQLLLACDDMNYSLEPGDKVQLRIRKTHDSNRPYVYRDRIDDIIEEMEERAEQRERDRHPEWYDNDK